MTAHGQKKNIPNLALILVGDYSLSKFLTLILWTGPQQQFVTSTVKWSPFSCRGAQLELQCSVILWSCPWWRSWCQVSDFCIISPATQTRHYSKLLKMPCLTGSNIFRAKKGQQKFPYAPVCFSISLNSCTALSMLLSFDKHVHTSISHWPRSRRKLWS